MIGQSLVLTVILASTAERAQLQPIEQCQVNDVGCFTRNHENFCSDRKATITSCKAWIRDLEARSRNGQAQIFISTGEAYDALSRLTSDPGEAERHRNHAIQIYRDLLRRDSSNAQAMFALAVATEDRSERVRLLRRAIDLKPDAIQAIQLLASELVVSGGSEQALEAAQVMEQAYARQSGRNKWYLASMTYDLYLRAGAPQKASEFRTRAIASLGLKDLNSLPADANPDIVSRTLMASCDHFVVPLLGVEKCLQDLELVIKQLVANDKFVRPQELASVAATMMEEVSYAEAELSTEYPTWAQTFRGWLESLRAKGFETAEVYSAIARFSSGDEQLNALKRAAALDPKSGQVSLRLGTALAARGMWKEAVQELTRAKAIVPIEQRSAVEYELDAARKRLAETAVSPTM